jgi:FixJ family two-component response regulator
MPEAKTVLCVVEYDALVRRALARLLRSAHFAVETFASVGAFLQYPHRETCSCLLLDIDIPGVRGQKLEHVLTEAQSHMPIICLTAHESLAANPCPSSAVTLLTQPFEDYALFAAIREALAQAVSSKRSHRSHTRPPHAGKPVTRRGLHTPFAPFLTICRA